MDGFGDDTQIRLKINLWGNDGPQPGFGDTALAIMPFVKFPTGSGDLTNDHVEGGVILPLAVALPDEFGLGLMAEVDVVYNEASRRLRRRLRPHRDDRPRHPGHREPRRLRRVRRHRAARHRRTPTRRSPAAASRTRCPTTGCWTSAAPPASPTAPTTSPSSPARRFVSESATRRASHYGRRLAVGRGRFGHGVFFVF